MWLALFAQIAGGDAPIGQWAPVVANLGVSVSLVLYLIIYANPKERREWAQTLKDSLKEQRADHERWQKDRDESWAKIISVITDARFEILREVRESLVDNRESVNNLISHNREAMNNLVQKINDVFKECIKELTTSGQIKPRRE